MVRKAAILTGVGQVRVTVAVLGVVHDHARGLHEGVTDGRADKGEAGFLECFAHGFSLRRDRRDLAAVLEMVDLGHAADKRPKQPHRVLQRQPGRSVAPGGVELEAVTHNAWIEHQCFDLSVGQLCQTPGIKTKQDLSIMLAFA